MNFSSALNIFKRETGAYFNAAIAYIFIIVFVLLSCGLYMTQFFLIDTVDMRTFFSMLPFILAVFMPAVTMRLWAEEKRGNTLELLLTFPTGTHEIVLGKFLASLSFYAAALIATLPIPIMLKALGNPDFGAIAGGYLGAFLLGAFFLAIGIFISGFCRDQIVAFILAMIVCFALQLAGAEFFAASIDGWLPGFGTFLRQFIGTSGHFDSFAKGVIDTRDFLYFLIGTAIFLLLNGFWLEGRMKPGAKKVFMLAAVLSGGIFLTGNWFLAGISLGRFDMTQGKIYTTSPATKKIFHDLKVPVTAKFYVSPADKMPTGMKTIEQDVLDKFEELRIASNGNFKYKVFHMEAANITEAPAPGKENEDTLEQQLQKKGIQPFQVRAIESDEVAVKLVYASVTLAYKEKPEEIIPRITPDTLDDMEYRVASKVYRMTLPEEPKITLVAPYLEKQVEPELAALLKQMGGNVPAGYREDLYEVVQMALEYEGYTVFRTRFTETETIPHGTKTLLLLEPKLNERQRYEISRFLAGGGNVMLAAQNYNYDYSTSGQSLSIRMDKKDPEVNPLLSPWGFEVDDQILVDEQHDVIQIAGQQMGPFEVAVPVKVPIQILVNSSGMNPDLSITSRLSPLFYLWGTALKVMDETVKNQNLKVDRLLTSSKNSWTVPPPQEGTLRPEHLNKAPESRIGPFPLAIMAQGQFADSFQGKPVPEWPKDGNVPASKTEPKQETEKPVTPAPGKLILVGSSTMFQKSLIRSGGHLNFFMNCVDALTLGDSLITIRSKQPVDRSVRRISSASKIGWRLFTTLLVPLLIAALGSFRALMRRRAKQNYLKELAAV